PVVWPVWHVHVYSYHHSGWWCLRAWSSGRADPVPAVRAGGCGVGGDRNRAATAALAAVEGGGVLLAGAGAVPAPGLCPGVGRGGGRPGWPGGCGGVGEGVA